MLIIDILPPLNLLFYWLFAKRETLYLARPASAAVQTRWAVLSESTLPKPKLIWLYFIIRRWRFIGPGTVRLHYFTAAMDLISPWRASIFLTVSHTSAITFQLASAAPVSFC